MFALSASAPFAFLDVNPAAVSTPVTYTGGWCVASSTAGAVKSDGTDHYTNWEYELDIAGIDNLETCMAACEAGYTKDNLACVEYKSVSDECYCLVIQTTNTGTYSMAAQDDQYELPSVCWYSEAESQTAVYDNQGLPGTTTARPNCCTSFTATDPAAEDLPTDLVGGVQPTCTNPPSAPSGDDDSSSNPCFGREMQACLLTENLPAASAFDLCFGDATGPGASRVPLAELRSGDLVLESATSASRVIVNEHVHSPHTSTLLTMGTAEGELVVTPDHYISTPTGFAAAGKADALVGASGTVTIEQTSVKAGKVVNPITVSGRILVATATGAPLLATTYGGWIAETALRFGGVLTSASLSNGLSFVFPVSAQAFHDTVIEPIAPSKAAFSVWSQLFTATPTVLHPIAFFVLDHAVAAGFVAWAMCSAGGAAIAAAAVLKIAARK